MIIGCQNVSPGRVKNEMRGISEKNLQTKGFNIKIELNGCLLLHF